MTMVRILFLISITRKEKTSSRLKQNNVFLELVDGRLTPLLSIYGHYHVLGQAGYASSIGGMVHRSGRLDFPYDLDTKLER